VSIEYNVSQYWGNFGKSESRRSVEVGQTGTSLRAGYRSRDARQRDIVYSTL